MQRNKQGIENSFARYQEDLNMIARKDISGLFDDIQREFIREFLRKLENYYDVFHGISDNNFYRNIDMVQEELKSRLNRISSQFLEDYQSMLKRIIKKGTHDMGDKVQKTNASQEYVNKARTIFDYNGYELLMDNNKLYARHKETKQVVELEYVQDKHMLVAKDKSIIVQVTDKYALSVNQLTNIAMVDYGKAFEISDIKRTNITKISQGLRAVHFYQNNKEVTELHEISTIIDKIESLVPRYISRLYQDENFMTLIRTIELEEAKKDPKYNEMKQILDELDKLSEALPSYPEENSQRRSGR